jgi:hypothetical protein
VLVSGHDQQDSPARSAQAFHLLEWGPDVRAQKGGSRLDKEVWAMKNTFTLLLQEWVSKVEVPGSKALGPNAASQSSQDEKRQPEDVVTPQCRGPVKRGHGGGLGGQGYPPSGGQQGQGGKGKGKGM